MFAEEVEHTVGSSGFQLIVLILFVVILSLTVQRPQSEFPIIPLSHCINMQIRLAWKRGTRSRKDLDKKNLQEKDMILKRVKNFLLHHRHHLIIIITDEFEKILSPF